MFYPGISFVDMGNIETHIMEFHDIELILHFVKKPTLF